jgi:ABC-type dipeptide/oligopeptide/nickel transport system permease subunit
MTASKRLVAEGMDLDAEALAGKPTSLWRTTMHRLFQRRSAIVGMAMLGILVATAILAPVIAPFAPDQVLIGIEEGVKKRSGPCIHLLGCPEDQPEHILGVDGNVRDFFSRMIFGSRFSLIIGFTTVGFAIVIGTTLGALAGYLGGWIDNTIMRVMDVLLAFPSLLLAIASVLSVKETDFVAASKALGASTVRILLGSVLPNAMAPLIVLGTLEVASAILSAAALSFLGLGAQPPTPEWGSMLSAERNQVFTAPHLVFFPGLAITLTVLGFNLLGDGLRDALDPRLGRGTKVEVV